jgi:acyl-CoA thioesterase
VNVSQREGKGYMFSCICSFKTAEAETLDVQADSGDLWEKHMLANKNRKNGEHDNNNNNNKKNVGEMEEAPGYDVPWYRREMEQQGSKANDVFPGLWTRQADLTRYNAGRHPLDKRQLVFYRTIGTLPPVDADPNLHLVAHLYASDRNSLFHVANAVGLGEDYSVMGSLVHQVIFHSGVEDLKFGRDEGDAESEWFVKEDSVTRYVAGRGLFYSRVWNSRGKHVLSVTQDGMVRIRADAKVEEIEKSWRGSVVVVQESEDVKRRRQKL